MFLSDVNDESPRFTIETGYNVIVREDLSVGDIVSQVVMQNYFPKDNYTVVYNTYCYVCYACL